MILKKNSSSLGLTWKDGNSQKNSFNPPLLRGLAQEDQSPSTHDPGGSIPLNFTWIAKIG